MPPVLQVMNSRNSLRSMELPPCNERVGRAGCADSKGGFEKGKGGITANKIIKIPVSISPIPTHHHWSST